MNREKIIKIIKNVVAVIVMISMFIIIYYQNRDRDIFKFGKSESSKLLAANQENLSGDAFARSDAQQLGSKVAFITPSSFSVLDKKGKGDVFDIAFTKPCLHTNGEYAAIYDEGTTGITVYKMNRQVYSVSTDNKIVKATVNANGYLLVTTEKEGYNCECVVYNKDGEAIFKYDISSSEFLDGMVNYSNNAIVLSVATAKGSKLYGELVFIDITTAKVKKRHTVESQLFYTLQLYKNDTCAAFSNSSLIYMNSDGSQKWKYDYSDRTLLKADVTDPDMMVLAFSPKGSIVHGTSTDVKVIDRLGSVIAEKSYDGNLEDISMSDDALALAFDKKIIIVDEKLNEKKNIESESSIKRIALYNNEKHVLVIGSSDSKILE